jgi:hypothetical protein
LTVTGPGVRIPLSPHQPKKGLQSPFFVAQKSKAGILRNLYSYITIAAPLPHENSRFLPYYH